MDGKLEIKPKKFKGESSVISIRIPNDLVNEIDKIADKTNRTRNEILLTCLEYAVNKVIIDDKEGK